MPLNLGQELTVCFYLDQRLFGRIGLVDCQEQIGGYYPCRATDGAWSMNE